MKTTSGFEIEIPQERFDNAELLDALSDLNAGDSIAVSRVLSLLLGKEDKKRLYDHCRAEDGRVPVGALATEIEEIFNSASTASKNS